MVTKKQAMDLSHGQVLHYLHNSNADGSPQRWRVNGVCKIWKRSPDRFQVPLKYGLYGYGYLDETNCNDFEVADE